DEINANGGIDGNRVVLLAKDDQNNKELARTKAEEFASENQVSVVIGHYYSSCCIEAQPIYKNAGIPSITPGATNVMVTKGSPWMFRVTFNDDFQGKFLAYYTRQVFQFENVIIIHDRDAYGSGLRNSFVAEAKRLNLNITKTYSFDNQNPDYSFIDKELKRLKTDIIFLAVHAPEGAELINLLRDSGVALPILGPDSLGRATVAKELNDTSDLYVGSPFIFDIGGKEAQVFREKYIKLYSEEPDWVDIFSYDAAMVVIEAIKAVGTDREAIRGFLLSRDSIANSILTATGLTYFDANGDCSKTISLGEFERGKLISYHLQLQTPTSFLTEPEIERALKDVKMFKIGSLHLFLTHVIYTGMDIIELQNFDQKESSFDLDFYLWFRWKGEIDPTNFEFINGSAFFVEKVKESFENGLRYICFRIKGNFRGEFPMQKYPFDSQTLRVRLKHKDLPIENLVYVVDVRGIEKEGREVEISDWEFRKSFQFSDILKTITSLGDPWLLGKKASVSYSIYNLAVEIKRMPLPFLIKFLIPLVIVVVISHLVFYIHPDEFEARCGIGITGILSAIAFHITQGETLPQVGYVITVDKFFILSYTMIFFTLLETVIVSRYFKADQLKKAKKIDRTFRYTFLPFFIIVATLLIVFTL
ncbi:MAG: ABC transporter substrate-binding protein, partial [Candidatus Aminicenantes bacterium]|nr:ABC transporter substrate-binding protein [Candidatus Aminicenantes bacterium]